MPTIGHATNNLDDTLGPDSGRRWARYPVDRVPIMVTAGTLQFEGVVVDESIGGIGIETDEAVALIEGQVVELSYHRAQLHGQVSAIMPNPDGSFRISFSWGENERASEEGEELAFLKFGPLVVVCETQPDGCDQQQSITLWDGKQFEISADRLTYRNKRARLVGLQMMGKERDMTAQLYGLDTQGSPHAVTKRIIEFEFDSGKGAGR